MCTNQAHNESLMTNKMNEKKIIPIRQSGPFTKEAKERWNKIPKSAQTKILNNVFCGKCLNSVPIVLKMAKMERADLILRGKCKICGHEVCRLIEPENNEKS